jgi:Family of unknown function (DUF5682)
MSDADAFASVRNSLFQPERGLFIAPVRHHSPACAWAVRALIREVKPKRVLIEAPADFASHIELLTHAETRPPVAIAALIDADGEHRVAAYYPFCVHAPEYVALQESRAIGAEVRFIDLPATDKAMLRETSDDAPVALTDERAFDSGDFIAGLCRRTGCRNGFELWDHLFETRLGDPDWRALLGDVGAYCAGIRAATAPDTIKQHGDDKREAHMGARLLDALADGGPVVVIVGGFHAPALIDMVASGAQPRSKASSKASRSFVIRYSFTALDALSGYAAGLPQPAYYDFLWRRANEASGKPVWREVGLDLASGFAASMREQGHAIGLPQQVEMLRAAEALALMRGRPGALRHDLIDAARTSLVKGEAGLREAWTERLITYLKGDAIGDVPASAGSPPLVEDARALARSHRIDVSDGAVKRRRLDIRRNAAHLAASRYFHAMTLLETGFAERESGPDYLHNVMTELLLEEWSYAWSPRVEGRLIELAARADRIDAACLWTLEAKREALSQAGRGRDIAAMTELFARGLLAGLANDLAPFLRTLGADIQAHADFTAVAQALRRLYSMARSAGPLGAPPELDLNGVAVAAYLRLVYLCDELSSTASDAAAERVEALRLMTELLNEDEAGVFDRALFDDAIDRVADANPPPEILGAVLAICVHSGRRGPDDLRAALGGQLSGSVVREEDRVAILRGMLHAVPQLLWRSPGVLEVIDNFLGAIDEEAFLALLPHLRLAFAALNPREVDQVAERLASLHGGKASAFAAAHHALSQRDLDRGLAIEQGIRASIAADGLGEWLGNEARP